MKADFAICMKQQEENRQPRICPSCGQPAKAGFILFTINDKAKMILTVLLLGYVMLSLILLGISASPEMRRGCGAFDWRWYTHSTTPDPNRCKDTEFTLWMKQINKAPTFRVFVGGGIATGVFLLYWEWFQGVHSNWQRKKKIIVQKLGQRYKYKCRYCGKQWN